MSSHHHHHSSSHHRSHHNQGTVNAAGHSHGSSSHRHHNQPNNNAQVHELHRLTREAHRTNQNLNHDVDLLLSGQMGELSQQNILALQDQQQNFRQFLRRMENDPWLQLQRNFDIGPPDSATRGHSNRLAPTAIGGYDLEYFGYLAMTFILFSVALAIIRSMFNRMMARLPEEKTQDWRDSFKRKFKRNRRENNNKTDDDKKESFLPKNDPEEQKKEEIEEEKQPSENSNTGMLKYFPSNEGNGVTTAESNYSFQPLKGDNKVTDFDSPLRRLRQASSSIGDNLESAKSMIGIGAGSKFQPVKAGVVEDDEESFKVEPNVTDIVQELDALIDVESTEKQVNQYMVMDELQTDL